MQKPVIMNKEKVGRRLDLVSGSAGSIISVATWCALQASSADIVMAAIDEKMRSTSTSGETRCALLFVIHELLLTCAANGIPETGKRSVLMAVSHTLPGTVQAVRALPGADVDVFEETLAKVVSWWSLLNIFPSLWMKQLNVRGDAERPTTSAGNASLPAQLRHVASLMAEYNGAKEEWLRSLQTSPARAASARGEALQQLARLRDVVSSKLNGGVSFTAWLDAEQSALDGSVQNTAPPLVGQKEEDDVLGSFF